MEPRPSRLPDPLSGPTFGTYAPDDVRWLLTDLSGSAIEEPRDVREPAIQSGIRHYSETLPMEFQPDTEYVSLFRDLTVSTAHSTALAIGTLAERILHHRTRTPVLVSLARAGTPVGVLLRRWFAYRHDLDVAHYAVSIIRDRGIDALALKWLSCQYRGSDIVFVDGWTGKGIIAQELARALNALPPGAFSGGSPNFDLAVVADPGGCTQLYGTREDLLITSSCLNSTVSGLISRTILNDQIRSDQFHGAKFYRELAGADESRFFIDTVTNRFDDAALALALGRGPENPYALGRMPDWRGATASSALAREFKIADLNLIKPGIGETTRVLLRRSPRRILVRSFEHPSVHHILELAKRLDVPTSARADLPYAAVGLISQVPS